MAKTNTGAKAVKLSKPTHIIVTPYNGDAKGTEVYDLDDVVRDTERSCHIRYPYTTL